MQVSEVEGVVVEASEVEGVELQHPKVPMFRWLLPMNLTLSPAIRECPPIAVV